MTIIMAHPVSKRYFGPDPAGTYYVGTTSTKVEN